MWPATLVISIQDSQDIDVDDEEGVEFEAAVQ